MRLLRPTFAAFLLTSLPLALWGPSPDAFAEKNQDRLSRESQKDASRDELVQVKVSLEQARERQKRLAAEIAALDKDRASINRALINTAKRGQELEAEISIEESRLLSLQGTQKNLRTSLLSKRSILAEVLAALQRMGRNPPPAILVRPEDALTSVRSAILLGAVVPEIRTETQTLLAELQALAEISRQIKSKKQSLAKSLNALAEDENRLELLIDAKNSTVKRSREQFLAEKKKTEELARKAKSLEDLIGQIESQIASAAAAAKAAKLADQRRAEAEKQRLAKAREDIEQGKLQQNRIVDQEIEGLDPRFADTTRIEPAIAFEKAIGLLPMPVSGARIHSFGADNGLGGSHNNVGIQTRPNSRVRSPADGWIVYAGQFRSYGQIIILNVGDGYHVVLSGMADVNVSTGQFVLAGEPVARMGRVQLAAIGNAGLSSDQPVLYVEFRKGKSSIDPSPWWADQKAKRSNDDT